MKTIESSETRKLTAYDRLRLAVINGEMESKEAEKKLVEAGWSKKGAARVVGVWRTLSTLKSVPLTRRTLGCMTNWDSIAKLLNLPISGREDGKDGKGS